MSIFMGKISMFFLVPVMAKHFGNGNGTGKPVPQNNSSRTGTGKHF